MNLKSFSLETTYNYGRLTFLTKAKNGKVALKNLINNSCDFKQILKSNESNNITIKVKRL